MENRELFLADCVPRYLKVEMQDGTLMPMDIEEESLNINESLCSEDTLRFGCCEASIFKLRILGTVIPMANKKIKPFILQETKEFQIGEYTVKSDIPTADRRYRDIVAYDAMYDILNADVTEWYNTILPDVDSKITLREFRSKFLSYFGIEQVDVELPNDSMIVTKTVEPSKLSGKTVITAICEINGCFGHIGRNGKFQYIFLRDLDLYPSDTLYPADDLFPGQPNEAEEVSKSHYISATYEDYETELIDKLQIRQEEDDIGYIYGDGDNCYIVQDNFLVYGKSSEELNSIAENLYYVIGGVWYRPAHVEAKGNPCLEVGDGIKLETSNGTTIYTYILQRTLKGIQALRDTYDAEGEQYQSADVNSVRESIIQLKGKTNKLTRTVDETRLEMKDIEKGLQAEITAVAGEVEISAEDIKKNIVSYINVAPGNITIKSDKIDLIGLVNANEFVSKYATIETLNVTTANLQNLIADKASISSLNSINAEIEELKANKIDASTVKADYMEVANWTNAGYIKADKIDVNTLLARTSIESSNAYLNGLHVRKLWDSSGAGLKVEWKYSSTLDAWYLSGVQSS